jgi:8-oxo-dGTP pyrophosphatase MutT (NUDIX family)
VKHRIRSAAIVIDNDKILLVKHKHPKSGIEFWVPPGGGLEDSESIYDCAIRETYEETGLKVILGEIRYLREFVDPEHGEHHFEIFIQAKSFVGELTISNVNPDDSDGPYVKEVKFLSQVEISGLTVYPEILKNEFWEELCSGKLQARYIGQQRGTWGLK